MKPPLAKQLESYAAAEEHLKQAKELLIGAGAFPNLVAQAERLQLRIHYEVKRVRQQLEHELDVANPDRHVAGGTLSDSQEVQRYSDDPGRFGVTHAERVRRRGKP